MYCFSMGPADDLSNGAWLSWRRRARSFSCKFFAIAFSRDTDRTEPLSWEWQWVVIDSLRTFKR